MFIRMEEGPKWWIAVCVQIMSTLITFVLLCVFVGTDIGLYFLFYNVFFGTWLHPLLFVFLTRQRSAT